MKQELKQVQVWDYKNLYYKIVPMKLYCVICGSLIRRRKKWMGKELYLKRGVGKNYLKKRGPQGVTCCNKCRNENDRRVGNEVKARWKLNHPEAREREKPRKREYMKKYYKKNCEARKEYQRQYGKIYRERPKVKERIKKYRKEWYNRNPNYNREYRKKQKLINIQLNKSESGGIKHIGEGKPTLF